MRGGERAEDWQHQKTPLDEYTQYYFNRPMLNAPQRRELLEQLVHHARSPASQKFDGGEVGKCLTIWVKLPPVIRYAILINGFRKIDLKHSDSPQTNQWTKESMSSAELPPRFGAAYFPKQDEGVRDYTPGREMNGLSLAWSWAARAA